MLDTHYYDGKLSIDNIKNLTLIKEYTDEHKTTLAKTIIDELDMELSRTAKGYMDKIVNDIGKPGNYESSNKLVADELLFLCWNYRKNKEFIEAFNDQLEDMQTGFCPQGRTYRLYQLLLAFQE
jgi:hypothetical protein